jgi:hypothetical protein
MRPLQVCWLCRWARPRCVREGRHQIRPALLWACVRHGSAQPVDDADCRNCPDWQTEIRPRTPPRT